MFRLLAVCILCFSSFHTSAQYLLDYINTDFGIKFRYPDNCEIEDKSTKSQLLLIVRYNNQLTLTIKSIPPTKESVKGLTARIHDKLKTEDSKKYKHYFISEIDTGSDMNIYSIMEFYDLKGIPYFKLTDLQDIPFGNFPGVMLNVDCPKTLEEVADGKAITMMVTFKKIN